LQELALHASSSYKEKLMKETMYGYISELPAVCKKNINHSVKLTKPLVDAFVKKEYKRLIIIASGSSFNGASMAKYFIERILKIKCDIITSFTFNNYETIFDADTTFVIGAGQSGRSVNTNDALQKAKDNGLFTVGLTANTESIMKDHCDLIMEWGAGIEKISFVTKGYTTLGLFLMLFALESSKRLARISENEYDELKSEFLTATDVMDKMVGVATEWYHRNEQDLTELNRLQVLGYGPNYAAALEGAIKIAETMGVATSPYELEEFLHGPSIETNSHKTVIIIDSLGSPSERAVKMYESVHYLTRRAFLITPKEIDDPKVCSVPHNLCEDLSTLVNVIPLQIIAAFGRDKWINPNNDFRKKMNDIMLSKAPATGKEKGF
jgi:glucoselysine-6-phosphate deglycase